MANSDGTLHRISVIVDHSTDVFHSSSTSHVELDTPNGNGPRRHDCARIDCTQLNIRFGRVTQK